MISSIFSTYSTGENRVTSSVLAVLQSLALSRIERLLGYLIESEIELVRFQNQAAAGGKGVPDGEIASSCLILIETKIVLNDLKRDQLQRHLTRLTESAATTKYLLVLTPDRTPPSLIDELADERLVWVSFGQLHETIDKLLNDQKEVISEREEYLLRELQKMLLAEGLLASTKDVVVVPARHAWKEYQDLHAYVCQESRPFRDVTHIAFYANNQIYPVVPRILSVHDHVLFDPFHHQGQMKELVSRFLERNRQEPGSLHKVFLLSAPNAPETVKLRQAIQNDLFSKNGQRTAFTQNQRYVSLESIQQAKQTSEFIDKSQDE